MGDHREECAVTCSFEIEEILRGIEAAFCACDLMAGYVCSLHTRLAQLRGEIKDAWNDPE